ncbi:MAG: hydroxylamine reductase, partial [Clostridium sp.]|nr:hydroxylamine reductase [Clostridium sp.]
MSMFCYQCQETAKGTGCTIKGVCGKNDKVANLQDLIIYTLKGIAILQKKGLEKDIRFAKANHFMLNGLFMTITNANFDDNDFIKKIKEGIELREEIKKELTDKGITLVELHDAATFVVESDSELLAKSDSTEVGILATENEDVRSLRELIVYGLKGMAAYAEHAFNLGKENEEMYDFIVKALVATLDDTLSAEDLVALTLETGKFGVDTMAMLDAANTGAYGNPEITEVNIGVKNNPAILISGHDLKDLEELLEQTKDSGVDVYTHGEMLPAHYYPFFKKYSNFVGNYGNAWWKQNEEFEAFNGPILFTTNCIIP